VLRIWEHVPTQAAMEMVVGELVRLGHATGPRAAHRLYGEDVGPG
jgi:hypothetical protein